MIQRIRSTFVGQYSLDKVYLPSHCLTVITVLPCILKDAKGDEAVEMAIQKPEKFVLKPQREGGGTSRHTIVN